MTHKDLVRRMTRWLRFSQRCGVVMAELHTQNNETPDVLGFYGAGGSILIECKASRADFFADQAKPFRQFEEMGMGDHRYFATPSRLVKPEEVPDGWGLLEVLEGRGVYKIKEPTFMEANKRAEVKMLMSAIRRLEISTAVFVQQSDPIT